MTKFKKSTLSLAVAAAVGGGFSSSYAVNLAGDGLGDVLIFPYYTTRNNWDTLFHIVNTSDEATVVLKFRFREAVNSRDVLDFNLVLSPNDVWTGWVATNSDGDPVFRSNDTSCTSPLLGEGVGFSNAGYTGTNEDAGPNDLDRAVEGYLAVIEMGHTLPGTQFFDDSVDEGPGDTDGVKDCAAIDQAFLKANIDDTSNQFGESINSLKGSFTLVNKEAGVAAGGDTVTLANFFTPGLDYAAPGVADGDMVAAGSGFAGNFGVTNLISAQQFPDFVIPTLNDANPASSLVQDNTQLAVQQTLIDTWTNPVDAVSATLMRDQVINEWSNNPVNGVQSYWVVTFPTKGSYVDTGASPTGAEIGAIGAGNPGFVGGPAPFDELFGGIEGQGQSCDTVTFTLYDRDENSTVAGGTAISPAPPTPADSLCFETNVLGFNPDRNLLMSNVMTAVDATGLVSGAPSGWLRLGLGSQLVGDTNLYNGLPVVGFALWNRNFGIPANNYAHLVDHSYTRLVVSS